MSSKTLHIKSTQEFSGLLSSSSIVVADFYADWCAPCKQIAPIYEQLSESLSRPNKITFTKIDVDSQQELARAYGVNAMPTFMIFKNARTLQTIRGANPQQLSQAVKKLASEAEAMGSGSDSAGGLGEGSGSGASTSWVGSMPRGYTDVTDAIDIKGLELLNYDDTFGNVRTLLDSTAPTKTDKEKKDWVESDTDEQLMLFIPFQSTLRVHSLYLTSHPPAASEEPCRPKTINLYTNKPHILGFDEAEDIEPTQSITLRPSDWDSKTGTAKIELRFVKFQNVSTLVAFVKEGEVEGSEKTRIDRIRIVGERGEKREMGKLEKVGEHD